MHNFLDKLWYGKHPLRWLLWPSAQLFILVAGLRRFFLQKFCQQQAAVPIIVVGNITSGGVGKTPLVVALVQAFQAKGFKPGIVSRGYGAAIKKFPHAVTATDTAAAVGDEPLLLAEKTACPVVIAPKRTAAVRYLLDNFGCDIIISDDGLQHYAMRRDVEIIVIDGQRGLGNGYCLPAGPLREKPGRLQQADFLILNNTLSNGRNNYAWPGAFSMTLQPGRLTHLASNTTVSPDSLSLPLAAVAGIGYPQRFFQTLAKMGLACNNYAFADHHDFQPQDLAIPEKNIIMTEKDAVKCRIFAENNWYYLPVEATLEDAFWQAFWSHERLKGYTG